MSNNIMIVLNGTQTRPSVIITREMGVVMIAVAEIVPDEIMYHAEVVEIALLTPRWIVRVILILPHALVISPIIYVKVHIQTVIVTVEHTVYVVARHNARRYRSRRHVMRSRDVPIRRQCEYSYQTQILFMSLSLLD